jgi:hypothetical protein
MYFVLEAPIPDRALIVPHYQAIVFLMRAVLQKSISVKAFHIKRRSLEHVEQIVICSIYI